MVFLVAKFRSLPAGSLCLPEGSLFLPVGLFLLPEGSFFFLQVKPSPPKLVIIPGKLNIVTHLRLVHLLFLGGKEMKNGWVITVSEFSARKN